MAVDETSLERIRKASFPSSRRGYDKREVEKFLNRLADWLETGGGDQARSDTVRRELERVGERTGSILAEAEESAQQIRGEAEAEAKARLEGVRNEADTTRKEAEAYAAEARAAADDYAKQQRSEADAYAEQTRKATDDEATEIRTKAEQDANQTQDAAEAQAERTIEDGVSRRRDIEAVIGDLASRRDEVIANLETLTGSLSAATQAHKPAATDPFATPDELDPLKRGSDEDGADLEAEAEAELPEELDREPELEPELEPEAEAVQEPEPEAKPKKTRGKRKTRAASKSKS